MSVAAEFAELFMGRFDAYGAEEGGCIYAPGGDWNDYLLRVQRHLDGTEPLGVYPQVDGGWVRWGCVDFDEGDEISWVHAQNLRQILSALCVVAWVERSRSKGYHVWVFLDEWVPARSMRHALLAACQVAGAPTKEVNPKQLDLAPGQVGNYVRLPYPGGRAVDRRVMVDGYGAPVPLDTFLHEAAGGGCDLEALEDLAALYQPPVKTALPVPDKRPMYTHGTALTRVDGLCKTIIEEGPLEGSDRSGTLYKLAVNLWGQQDLTNDERLDLLVLADERWGKFMRRPNGRDELQRMLERAWRDA